MSLIRPPIAAVRLDTSTGTLATEEVAWEVTQAFPTDPSAEDRDDWRHMLTRYRFAEPSGAEIAFRAPATGRLQLARHGGEIVLVYLPSHPGDWSFAAGGWFSPHGNALVLHSAWLQEVTNQRMLAALLLSQNIRDGDRGVSIEGTSGSFTVEELVSLADAEAVWDRLDRGDEEGARREADRLAELHAPAVVDGWLDASRGPYQMRQEAILLLGATELSLGWARIPTNEDGLLDQDDAWYWMDVDEVFRRLDESGVVEPRIQWRSPRGDGRLRAWYEREELPPRRITRLRCGDLDLYAPPPGATPIAEDILRLRPGAPVDAYTASSDASWFRVDRVDPDSPPTSGMLGDPVGAGPSTTIELAPPTATGSDSPDIEAFRVLVVSRTDGGVQAVTLRAFPSVVQAAEEAAHEIEELQRELGRFLDSFHHADPYVDAGHFHEPVSNRLALELAQLQDDIIARLEQTATQSTDPDRARDLRRLAGDLRDRVRDGGVPRSMHVRTPYFAISTRTLEAARRLNALFTPRLVQEVTSDPTARTIAAFNTVLDAMGATQEGRHALQERLSGFIDQGEFPGVPAARDPILTVGNWRRLWWLQSSLRAPLAATFVKAAEVDVYVRTLNRLLGPAAPGTVDPADRAYAITRLTEQFEEAFDARLTRVRIRRQLVTTIGGAEAQIPVFIEEVRAPSDLTQAAGRAGSMVHALNILNTLGQLVTAGLAASDYANEPNSTNRLSLARGIQGVVAGGVTMAEHTATMTRGYSGALLRSIRGTVGTAGLVLGGAALADEVAATRRLAATGDDDQLFWRRVGIGAWATSMGLEAVALAGISTGPVGTALAIACVVTSIAAAAIATAVADLPVELDFTHSLLGDDYRSIAQLRAPDPAAPPPAHPLDRGDTGNLRGDFYRSLPTQISQLKGNLFPLRATFAPDPGILASSNVIRLRPTAVEGSIVLFQIWRAGDPINQRLTDFFQLREGNLRFTTGPALGGTFNVIARPPTASRDHWEVDIFLDTSDRPGNRVPDADIAAVAVSLDAPVGALAAAVAARDELAVRRIFLDSYAFAARTIVELADA